MKSVIINGKTIKVKPIDFEGICDLEDLGFEISSLKKKTFSSMRCATAYQMGISLEEATTEIENHIKNGGKASDFAPFIEAIYKSDFFEALMKSMSEE